MKQFTLTYDKELELNLELYLPDAENPPLLIYIHGGGIEAGSRHDMKESFIKMAEHGYAVASPDYRMYPKAKFPEFIEDCAKCVDFMLHECEFKFSKTFIGGSSAGSYLSMMLLFDKSYLARYNLDPMDFDGWILDAGQPTVHFNVLRERGLDSRLVRLDEAAPLWHISENFKPTREDGKFPMVLNISSSNDMTCRLEQLKLLNAAMLQFGWPASRLHFVYMNGYSHCGYIHSDMYRELLERTMR